MKAILGIAASVVLTGTVALSAQAGGGATKPQTVGDTAKQSGQQITVSGCVQRESDYRKEQDKGRGGVAGTGIGADNEFVLTNLSKADAKDSAYELTGTNEKLAASHINHRVEVTGMLKAAEATAGGKPTGGSTAGAPPTGVDVASKDLRLRELEVASVKMVAASCGQ
jgi:hypothetical protein